MVLNADNSPELDSQRLLTVTPLNESLDITAIPLTDMLRLIYFSNSVDIYYVGCKRMSVSQGTAGYQGSNFNTLEFNR